MLSATQRIVYDMIASGSGINGNDIVAGTGLSRSTISRALKVLQEQKLIRRAGSKKTGHWEAIR